MKYHLLIISFILFSCQKNENSKWYNSNNACDSLSINSVSNSEYVFKFGEISIPAFRDNNKFTLQANGKEAVALLQGDTILVINGDSYIKVLKDKIGNLSQNWESASCLNSDYDNMIIGYDKQSQLLNISEGPFQLNLKLKKISNSNFDLYFDSIDGSISLQETVKYVNENVDNNFKVGEIIFLSNKMIELNWIGLKDTKENKTETFLPFFKENNTTSYFLIANN